MAKVIDFIRGEILGAVGSDSLRAADEARSQRVSASRLVSDTSADWAQIFSSNPTASGVAVTQETAERVSAVFACISLIAKTVATLPLHVYRRLPGGGKERAFDHPLYPLLHDTPNSIHTSVEFREMMQSYLAAGGNAYAVIERDGAGRVFAINPVKPERTQVYKFNGKLFYQIQTDSESVTLDSSEVLHVRGRSKDGIFGMSPIAYARESIGLAMVAERHGASYFGNGAKPSGVIETSATLKPDQVKEIQNQWEERHSGPHRMQRPAVLWGGTKWTPFTISNEDAQFLETRKFQVTDIARIFGVPPHKIGDLGQATFSNIEHQSIEFLTDCIRPWLVRWEQRMNAVLLLPSERAEYFVEFSVDGLLRGDLKSRYEAYNIGRNAGFLSANDVRDLENMNRIDGGDTYMQPLNMSKLGEFQSATTPKAGGSTQ